MWWQLFFVLVTIAAASEDDSQENRPTCWNLMYHECGPENTRTPEFPGNEEELEAYCNKTLKYYDCINRFLSSCEGEVTRGMRHAAETQAFIRRVCNEDAVFRTAVADNLPCFKANLSKIQTCDGFIRHRDSFSAAMNELGVTKVEGVPNVERDPDAEEDDEPENCLESIYEIGCMPATASELCGNEARDVVLNVLQGFDTLFELCPPGTKEKLPEIVRVIQAENGETVEYTLKKKK